MQEERARIEARIPVIEVRIADIDDLERTRGADEGEVLTERDRLEAELRQCRDDIATMDNM